MTIPTILLVDDDDIVRTIMRAELEDEGFQVMETADGLEALEACRQIVPDLLVVDVVMPRMDGYELCQALRRDPRTAFAPILMATGLDDEASIAKAYVVGATDFIPKPLQWTILRQRVRYMLRSSEAFQELRRNQAYLIAAKEAAEAGDRAKSEFLAAMSHELRTPLNAVIGLSSVMQAQTLGALTPNYLELIGMILDNGRDLLSMIENVLDLARAESNELSLTSQRVDVAEVVAEVEAAAAAQADRAGVIYRVQVEAGLPPIMADPAQLKRILHNLVDNALKFTPKGGQASLTVLRDAAGALCLKVADTGAGMAPGTIARALSPFGLGDGGSTRSYGGAGVGLPLARRLVELHGGTLDIDSEEGRGTTITVRLPEQLFVQPAADANRASHAA